MTERKEMYLGISPGFENKPGPGLIDMSGIRAVGQPIVKQAHNQSLVDLFTNMPAEYREIWLTKPVMLVQDQWRKTADVGHGLPNTVQIHFHDGPTLQYTSRHIVCEIASAMQECADWKPSPALADYLNQHRKIRNIVLRSVINREGTDFMLLDSLGQGKKAKVLSTEKWMPTQDDFESIGRTLAAMEPEEDKPAEFSKTPFKVIQDYLHACAFLSPFAPNFVDYANDLLTYRLGYSLSQEKNLLADTALRGLAQDLNDYAAAHAENAYGLHATMRSGFFGDTTIEPSLLIVCDFATLTVKYEPDLTSVDWEKRYQELRTRHAG